LHQTTLSLATMIVGSRIFGGTPVRRFAHCAPRSYFGGSFFPFGSGVGSLLRDLDLTTESVPGGPRVTVKGKGENVVLEFDVPRYKLSDINVSAKNGTLTVHGKNSTPAAEDEQYLYGEPPFQTFNKSFMIPTSHDVSKLKTVLEHGVLTVEIPKVEIPQPVNPPAKPEKTDAVANPRAYDELATMSWPPQVKVNETATNLTFSVQLPEAVNADNISMTLQGRTLNLNVAHKKNVTKKDEQGNVVFNESQSVCFSTPLTVPARTSVDAIETKLEKGVLSIIIAKAPGSSQSVKVN